MSAYILVYNSQIESQYNKNSYHVQNRLPDLLFDWFKKVFFSYLNWLSGRLLNKSILVHNLEVICISSKEGHA